MFLLLQGSDTGPLLEPAPNILLAAPGLDKSNLAAVVAAAVEAAVSAAAAVLLLRTWICWYWLWL